MCYGSETESVYQERRKLLQKDEEILQMQKLMAKLESTLVWNGLTPQRNGSAWTVDTQQIHAAPAAGAARTGTKELRHFVLLRGVGAQMDTLVP